MNGQSPKRIRSQNDADRDQRWIEKSVLASSPFDWDALSDECPLLRGELGKIFRSAHTEWLANQISEALTLFLFVLDREEAQAYFLHLQKRSDHDIGRILECDPKTAKVRWMSAMQKLADNSTRGEADNIDPNEDSRQRAPQGDG